MPDTTVEFAEYSYLYTPAARRLRDQLPRDLLPKLINVIDELAANPEAFPLRLEKIGQGANGEILLYTHPDLPLEIMYEVDRKNQKLTFMHFAARVVELKPVFVSYSHTDEEWLQRLRKFLRPLEDRGLIRLWDDTKIQAGANWRSEIEKSLKSAKMAVFLVTQDFLNSDFINASEMPPLLQEAEQGGVQLFWIAVKPCTVQDSVLAKFQAANDPKQPLAILSEPMQDQVLVQIYEKIKAAVA